MSKKNTYIDFELDWLQGKAQELKGYVDANPFDKMVDRVLWKETKNGGAMPMVAATIESQVKSITQAMKDYAQIIEVVDKLREKEEAKQINVRGDQNLSPFESGDI